MTTGDPMQQFRINKHWRSRVFEYVELQNSLRQKKNSKGQDESCSPEQFCKKEGLDINAFRWWMDYIKVEDRYTFFRSFATEYLSRAKRALELLDEYIDKDKRLRMPLIRDAIISYSAVFSKNNSRIFTKIQLEAKKFVPQAMLEIHKKICSDRDSIYAHCDIGARNPHVSSVGISMVGKGFYWEDYMAMIPQFKQLIEDVLAKLEVFSINEKLMSPEDAFQNVPEPPASALKEPEVCKNT